MKIAQLILLGFLPAWTKILGIAPLLCFSTIVLMDVPIHGQEFGQADRGEPGDAMIQEYLRTETRKLETDFLPQIKTAEQWEKERPTLKKQYLHMLGLDPLPEKTPLKATITRTFEQADY